VLKAGVWYLVAARDGEPRTFRVDSIEGIEVLDAPSARPARFDLESHWVESVQRFERDLHVGHAQVSATARGLALLRQLSAPVARALRDAAAPEGEKNIVLQIPIEAETQAAAQLLALAPHVQVLAPASLREAVVRRLETCAAAYGCSVQRPARSGPRKTG